MPLSKQFNINWKRKDYITLGRAVAAFNKKINELNAEEKKVYLPEVLNYPEVKENIKTRSELNRVINSLRRFTQKGAEDIYTTKAGEKMTKWERRELSLRSSIAQRRLTKELKGLEIPGATGFSRVQMGSQREKEIRSIMNSLKNIENKVGYEFERLKRRIEFLGTSDYTLKMSYVYRQNFMEQVSRLANNSPEFKRIYDYLNDIKNPV